MRQLWHHVFGHDYVETFQFQLEKGSKGTLHHCHGCDATWWFWTMRCVMDFYQPLPPTDDLLLYVGGED